ncbi:MAG TPA: ABC transporter permease [Chloroflexi bacterium]|nr:ABC transporter permease [Chloroflexota bacterium]
MSTLKRTFKDIVQYPSAVVGLIIIAFFIVVAVYTVSTIPYSEAIRLWRGGEDVWGDSPRTAQPLWTNWFRRSNLPETIILDTADGTATKTVMPLTETMTDALMEFTFDYPYGGFPQELTIFFTADYQEKPPHADLYWVMPDGAEIRVGDTTVRRAERFRFALDGGDRLMRRLEGLEPQIGLFAADREAEELTALQGTYTLRIEGILFEKDSDFDAKLVVYGQAHGWGGTDLLRRDLMVALLWGTPIALSFGLLAALGTTVTTMIIAAAGVWFGGIVDELIQRITEINMILPFLPILIMVGTFQSQSIWVMLQWIILLSIFGASIKGYRAIFLQIKEAPYIEAARAYGAGNGRIIFLYLIPRIIPVLIPNLVNGIPAFVFLEASLAVLGLGDPVLPTWGKVIEEARHTALYQGQYYWILQPAALLMLTGLAFAMVGFALDRIFNPRLREV